MEIGPENRISRISAAGYRGRICPCCINRDRKGRSISFGFQFNGSKDSDFVKPIHRMLGKKGRTLRNHRKG